ncbi:hypothetical protein J1605_019524 [Eschrichtius robustus]|uniref:Ig-like domain-containing protein n=1 Tax=Eschrichtius robustus TaxID=9764 RepID=A0AB34HMI0_ESCRO|nr:hypothetical protein J1605_019524 [Eschrichtius robustus]
MGWAPGGTHILTQLTFTATFEVAVTLVPYRDEGLSALPNGTVGGGRGPTCLRLVTLPRARAAGAETAAEAETFLPALSEVSRSQNRLGKSTGRGKSRKGAPLPTLRWFKDAVSINKLQNPRYQVLSSGGLRVQKLRPEDSGIFQCFASNEGGEVQTYTYLDVTSEYYALQSRASQSSAHGHVRKCQCLFSPSTHVAPAFTQLPADTTVTDGATAVLSCAVSGAPRPAIAWRRGRCPHPLEGAANAGSEPSGPALCLLFSLILLTLLFCLSSSGNRILASGSVRIPRFMLLESGGLQITPVLIQDAGNYTCCAANSEGSLHASATLTVWSKDHSPSLTGKFCGSAEIQNYNSARLVGAALCGLQGSSRASPTLFCPSSRGSKFRLLSWCQSSALLRGVQRGDTHHRAVSGALALAAVECRAAAVATCVFPDRTSIVNPPEDRVVIKGTTATLHCGTTHDPRTSLRSARYVWKKDNVVITPSGSSRIVVEKDGSLLISQTWSGDIGDYTCGVISEGGNDSRTARLEVM